MSPRSRGSWIALLAAVAALAAGCGSGGTSAGPSTASSTSTTSTTSTTAASSPAGDAVVAGDSGIAFVPIAGWKTIDSSDVNLDDPRVTAIADQLGMSHEQFQQLMSSVELISANASAENANVVQYPASSLPGESDVRSQMGGIGATDMTYTTRSTPIGEGAVATYTLSIDSPNRYGAAVIVMVDGHVAQLTVTAASADAAKGYLDQLIPTLRHS